MVFYNRRLSGGVSRETRETCGKGLHHACHLWTQRPHGRPSSRKRLESHAFRRRPSGRPCTSLRSAQVPGCPDGLLSMPVKTPDAQRTAECPGRDGRKEAFRAVDGRAPARAKHGGFIRHGFRVFRVFRVFRGKVIHQIKPDHLNSGAISFPISFRPRRI